MYRPFLLLSFLVICFNFVQCSPRYGIQQRQNPDLSTPSTTDIDCSNEAAMFFPECWILLGLSEWLNDPEKGWNKTTPVCGDTTRCCQINEAWSTCFLRLGRGLGGADCTTVDDQACTWDNTVSPNLDPSIKAQVRYTIKSIYGVHDFFSSYFKALQYATTQTNLMITPLTNTIDPDKDTLLGLQAVMFVLSFGLAFLTAPTVAVAVITKSQMSARLLNTAQAFAISSQQAPAVARTIWPAGNDASRTFQISQLQTELNNATDTLAEILDRGLKLLMSDMPTFVAFSQSGAYCGNGTIDIADKTDGLDLALRTYLTSESMKQNGWYAVPLRISTKEEYDAMKANAYTDGPKHWYEGPAVVEKIWWSPYTGRQYSLEQKNEGDPSPKELLYDIDHQNWADIATLIEGSYNCTMEGRAGDTNELIRVHFDSTLDTSCISRLPIYVPCGANCPQKLEDGTCPFGFKDDCSNPGLGTGTHLAPELQQPGFVNPPP